VEGHKTDEICCPAGDGLQVEGSLRRSTRRSIKPLDYWRNEKTVYERKFKSASLLTSFSLCACPEARMRVDTALMQRGLLWSTCKYMTLFMTADLIHLLSPHHVLACSRSFHASSSAVNGRALPNIELPAVCGCP